MKKPLFKARCRKCGSENISKPGIWLHCNDCGYDNDVFEGTVFNG